MQDVRFDDIPALEALARLPFGQWGPEFEITQALIDAFAELSGDHQWIHVDVERARRESPFGGTVAHGFLTLSLLPRLHPENDFRIVGFGNALNYGASNLRFLSPVPAGSRIHARSRLKAVAPHAKGTLLTWATEVHVIGGGDKPALLYEALALYQPARAAG